MTRSDQFARARDALVSFGHAWRENSARVTIVQGGQYGSEGKGNLCHRLALGMDSGVVVRVGGPNAGHTIIHEGEVYKMQQVPVGWVNPDVDLAIAAGSVVNPDILRGEIERIGPKSLRGRLMVDPRASVHTDQQTKDTARFGRTTSIGSTGKGVSQSVVRRIQLRGTGAPVTFGAWAVDNDPEFWEDYVMATLPAIRHHSPVLVESSQGALLDITHGPYPYVTHRQTTPSQWLADIGLPPRDVRVIMVVRTIPIRVAGNSGPLPSEVGWWDVARRHAQYPEAEFNEWRRGIRDLCRSHGLGERDSPWEVQQLQPDGAFLRSYQSNAFDLLPPGVREVLDPWVERTTVTGLVRRVAMMSLSDLRRSAALCGPDEVALMFCDKWFPDTPADHMIKQVREVTGAPVTFLGRGRLPPRSK